MIEIKGQYKMQESKSQISNRIIIIGGCHHNTLSVVRAFGKTMCNFYVLIHEQDSKNNWITTSKYLKDNYIFIGNNEKAILNWLLVNKTSDKKSIVFPCSDLAAYTIDNNREKLIQNYYLHGFSERAGLVVWFMDKYNQYKFACENNILMARTQILQLDKTDFKNINNDIFPCILKPIISAYGNKADISIAHNLEEYLNEIQSLKNKGYHSVLVQEFVEKDYEVCAFGCIISQQPKYVGCILRKLRIYPKDKGSLTYAKIVKKKSIQQYLDNILDVLYNLGYRGTYDIELFIKSNQIYLNEINFRHSGNGAFLIENDINIPYYWALDKIGLPIKMSIPTIKENEYFMDMYMDFRFRGTLPLSQWLLCLRKTHTFTIWSISDIKPSFVYGERMLKRGIAKLLRGIKKL